MENKWVFHSTPRKSRRSSGAHERRKPSCADRLSTGLLVLVLLAGLGLFAYPSLSDWWNSLHQTRAIEAYSAQVDQLDPKTCRELLLQAQAYNEEIHERSNPFLLSQEEKTRYEECLDLAGNGVMGYLEIPAIRCYLPVYHGTEESVLQVAVGHLEWTSLPVGGEGTHCVLSGHRGLPSARLFTDLDRLAEGDVFLIHVLDETLTYQVDQILIVEPQDTEALMPQPGQDLCTLVTCTPYGINTHRLLVRGHRVETEQAPEEIQVTADAARLDPLMVAPVAAAPMLLALLVVLFIPRKGHSKQGEGDEHGEEP